MARVRGTERAGPGCQTGGVTVPAAVMTADELEEFLAGGHAMDEHFRHTPFEQNLPVLLGLLAVWNSNFLGAETVAPRLSR